MTYREEFITFMVRSGVLTFGDFTTKSGRKTPYFVNTGNYKTGAQAAKLGDYYAACIQEHMADGVTCLFGPAYKGIPLADACLALPIRSSLWLCPLPPPCTATTAGTCPTASTARRPRTMARVAPWWDISPKTGTMWPLSRT